MADNLSKEVKAALADPDTIKALATIDKNGIPYVVYKSSIHALEDGRLEYYEILESSQTNKNLVSSIWFNKTVSINILTKEKLSYQILAKPVRSITAGKYFEKAYNQLQSGGRDIDLGAIWQFEILSEKEETFAVRVQEDEAAYPLLKHVDRVLKKR